MPHAPRIAVLGSLNMDISVTVPELPAPGATVLGDAAAFTPGGKGANQAVAAARLGGQVTMAGCTGADDFGARLRAALDRDGVDTSGVAVLDGVPTGLAMITVDASGENTIAVAPGANHQVGVEQVRAALESKHGRPDIVVLSAEIPLAAIEAARDAAGPGTICLLNLAPAPQVARAATVLAGVDWLVVNETEAAAILCREVRGLGQAAGAAVALVAAGARNAVVTAGPDGVALAAGRDVSTVPAFKAEAVDTVGAGDTFTGALALALAAGLPPAKAAEAASAAAATAVTRRGAQAGMPRPADIEATLGYLWPLGALEN